MEPEQQQREQKIKELLTLRKQAIIAKCTRTDQSSKASPQTNAIGSICIREAGSRTHAYRPG